MTAWLAFSHKDPVLDSARGRVRTFRGEASIQVKRRDGEFFGLPSDGAWAAGHIMRVRICTNLLQTGGRQATELQRELFLYPDSVVGKPPLATNWARRKAAEITKVIPPTAWTLDPED